MIMKLLFILTILMVGVGIAYANTLGNMCESSVSQRIFSEELKTEFSVEVQSCGATTGYTTILKAAEFPYWQTYQIEWLERFLSWQFGKRDELVVFSGKMAILIESIQKSEITVMVPRSPSKPYRYVKVWDGIEISLKDSLQ